MTIISSNAADAKLNTQLVTEFAVITKIKKTLIKKI